MPRVWAALALAALGAGCAADTFSRVNFSYASSNHMPPEEQQVVLAATPDQVTDALVEVLRQRGGTLRKRERYDKRWTIGPRSAECWKKNYAFNLAAWKTIEDNDFSATERLWKHRRDYVPQDWETCSWAEELAGTPGGGWFVEAELDKRDGAAPGNTLVFVTRLRAWAYPEGGGAGLRMVAVPVDTNDNIEAADGNSIGRDFWPYVRATRETDTVRSLQTELRELERTGALARGVAAASAPTAGATPVGSVATPSGGSAVHPASVNAAVTVDPPVITPGGGTLTRLAVPAVAAGAGTKDLAGALGEVVTAQAGRAGRATIIGASDIDAMLGFQKQKDLLGCADNTACIAEIGGALGVDAILVTSLSRLGSTYVMSARVIETRGTRVLARTTGKLVGEPDGLIELAQQTVQAVLGPLNTAPEQRH